MRRIAVSLAFALFLVGGQVSLVAGATPPPGTPIVSKEKSLYERLGGKKAIEAVVDEFIGRVAADTRINHFFAKTASDQNRLGAFRQKLIDQICQATGGPCKYKGADMKTAHRGMGVTGEAFQALVEDLIGALDKFNVPAAEKNELLGLLAPMKSDIVEK